MPLGGAQRIELVRDVVPRQCEDVGAPDHLHRLPVLHGESGAQRLVSPNNFVESTLERHRIEPPGQPQGPGKVVGEVAGCELIDEPELLLRERAPRRAPRCSLGCDRRPRVELHSLRVLGRPAVFRGVPDARHGVDLRTARMLVRDRNGAYATLEGLHDRAAAKLAGRVGGDGSFCPKVAWCALQPGPSILVRPDSFRAEPARPKREAEGVTQDVNDGTASFRLSPQQEHLWRSYPSGPLLTVRCLIDVGEAASDAVQTALGLVVERHEILRTTFVRRQGLKLPNQVINERLDIAWQDADAAGLAGPVGDLGRGPVLRAGFLVETGGNRLLALTIPAVCADARSLIVLASELRAELAKPAASVAGAAAVRRLRRVA